MTSWISAGSGSGGITLFPMGTGYPLLGRSTRRESIGAQLDRAGALRNRQPRPLPGHRIDKAAAGVGMALPARFQHMAQQEQSREPKTVVQVLIRPAVRAALVLAQERRQPQQPVSPGIARGPRHRAAGFR